MKSLKKLGPYFVKYKKRLILGTFFITISNVFAIYPAEILRKGIDLVSESLKTYQLNKGTLHAAAIESEVYKTLLVFGLIVIATALLKGVFMFLMRQTIIVMSRLVEFDMKNDIYQHYQKLDIAFYKRNKTGDLMARISEDVSQVRMYVGPAIMYAISTLTLFALITVKMLSIHVMLTVYVLLPLPLLAILIYLINSKVIKKSEAVQQQLSTISSVVQEFFSGIRVIKAYNRAEYANQKFSSEAGEYQKRNIDLIKVNALFFPMIVLLIGLSTLITIYFGGLKVFDNSITTGTIAEFIMYVNMLTWPVASIGWITSIVQRAAASQTRINEFLDQAPTITNNNDVATPINGEIVFENVSFHYPDATTAAIKDVNFRIPIGKSLAIVGRTGAGKSSLAALIARMYDCTSGTIKIDGINIQQVNLNSLRSSIGYVPQEVFLFSDTIANNISFGLKGGYTENEKSEKIIQAAKDSAVYDNIIDFPEGFETKIGERGITLSGGQKQRVSIARAIIRKPEILIFDDCLSAVDTETEEKILKSLSQIMKGRTTIIIAHRISSIKDCDAILVLDEGEVVEYGTHQELMEKEGMYFQLHQQQLLEEERIS
jgi:ATP-binding cassette subfamily B multidrug efflux pump